MRILVTGRDGQVARSLADRRPDSVELVFAARPTMDLADPASIRRAITDARPDIVVSAAAYTAVDRAEQDAEAAHAVNAVAPGVIAEAAAAIGAPVIHLSTDYVFDGSLDRPYREDDPVAPLGVYGSTKLAGEHAVRGSGAAHAILRTAWVYGPHGANFVKTMLRLAGDRDTLTVVEDQIGCPTASLAIADAIYAVVAAWDGGTPAADQTGVFHFAGIGTASWADFAREILRQSAARGGPDATVQGIPTSAWPTPAARPANSRLDCARFAAAFGHRAPDWRVSLAETIKRLIPA